jgi:aspartyl protease family protein
VTNTCRHQKPFWVGLVMRGSFLAAMMALVGGAATPAFATDVQVLGLFNNTAVLAVDGAQQTVKAGQQKGGVLLVSANPREAVVEINGERRTLSLSDRISSHYEVAPKASVSILLDTHGRYETSGAINGRQTRVLVDTGATSIAMNSDHAAALGVDFRRDGRPINVRTASGIASAYSVNLRSVNIGGIEVHNVQAAVIEGGFPQEILLGMTYLSKVSMRHDSSILYLEQKI